LRRRDLLSGAGAAAIGFGISTFPDRWVRAEGAPLRRLLVFTRSQGYEHSVVKRLGSKPSLVEQTLTDLGKRHGFDVTCTKDGTVFTPRVLSTYDAMFFYTTGDLTKPGGDGGAPMTVDGKAALLGAVHGGKGFVAAHAATDTFLTAPEDRYTAYGSRVDPYVAMIGAEFIHHDSQQEARSRVVDRAFPGFEKLGESFELMEEWYSLKDFAPNLHVLLVQETEGMAGPHYKRAPYPSTWARLHGKGRVFYTSLGHREDVWANPMFESMLLGGIAWAVRNVDADVQPNLATAAPSYKEIPPKP
jgi:type 1 glutamine amidotransferase